MKELLPDHLVQQIQIIPIGNQNKEDQSFWALSDNGKYTNKSAWNLVRKSSPKVQFIDKVWNSTIPFKMSFLVWRLWHSKLPFDDVIIKYGKQIVSRCNCCSNPNTNNINHVFVEGQAASYIWKLFGNALGIQHQSYPIRYIINKWWTSKALNDVHRLVLNITPVII